MEPERLDRKKLIETLQFLDVRASTMGIRYAVIGGALFKLLGIEDVETCDIDVAASGYLDLPPVPPLLMAPSWCPDGHYRVNGVSIDWMPHGKKGGDRLFFATIQGGYVNKDGIWCATLEHAMAIKLFAGRPKDIELFNRLANAGKVNRMLVLCLIRDLCHMPDAERAQLELAIERESQNG